VVGGKRTDSEATELVTKVKDRSDGSLPLFISDNLDAYPHALLNVYGEERGRSPSERSAQGGQGPNRSSSHRPTCSTPRSSSTGTSTEG
jgi:hypothetical protein